MLDISTGEFLTTEGNQEQIDKLIQSFQPKEILYERSQHEFFSNLFANFYLYKLDDWYFNFETAYEKLKNHFQVNSLKGFGINELKTAICACGAILHYLDITQHQQKQHINKLSRLYHENYVWIDKFSLRNLELLYSPNEKARTLIDIIDKTQTPIGSRLLKRWISFPLIDITQIKHRLNIVEFFVKHHHFINDLNFNLKQIGDLERLVAKISIGKANPRDVIQLHTALKAIHNIKNLFTQDNPVLSIVQQLNECSTLASVDRKSYKPRMPCSN